MDNKKKKIRHSEYKKFQMDEEGYKICLICNQRLLAKDNYLRRTINTDGYEYRCLDCFRLSRRDYSKIRRDKQKEEMDSIGMAKMTQCSLQDYMNMYEFLRKIGYDTTKDCHQQFLDRHDLNIPYRERKSSQLNMYLHDGTKNPLHRSIKGK